jgi:hypothetical protein
VFPTDTSLATPLPLSQHHDIPPALPIANSRPQPLPILTNTSLQTPGLSPPSLSQSPQDPRLSPRTPEQEFGRSLHEAHFDSTKTTSPSLNHHGGGSQLLGYQIDPSSSQRYPLPTNFSREAPEQQIQLKGLSTSPLSRSSSSQPSPEPGILVQTSPQHIPSRSRRKHDRQFKCSSCSKVFPRRCDLK